MERRREIENAVSIALARAIGQLQEAQSLIRSTLPCGVVQDYGIVSAHGCAMDVLTRWEFHLAGLDSGEKGASLAVAHPIGNLSDVLMRWKKDQTEPDSSERGNP